MIDRIHWLGHNCFVVQGPPLIYINPSRGIAHNAFLADVVLISQATYENCSPQILNRLCSPSTVIIANTAGADCLAGLDVQVLRPWQSVSFDRARITAIPSHPTRSATLYAGESPAVGYLISLDYYDLYYAGDTVLLPDTMALHPDIAILPVRNVRTGLLDIEHAVDAVRKLRPRWVIPSHWNEGSTGLLDVRTFRSALDDLVEVVLPAEVSH